MKKTTRLLALLLCVLSIAALLPTVAFAAEPVDEVSDAFAGVIANVKEAAIKQNTTLKRRVGTKQTLRIIGAPSTAKYQWQVKKTSSSRWTNISGAKKSKYTFKITKSINGRRYRCVVKVPGYKTWYSPVWIIKVVK